MNKKSVQSEAPADTPAKTLHRFTVYTNEGDATVEAENPKDAIKKSRQAIKELRDGR